jgi:hypothetical protein
MCFLPTATKLIVITLHKPTQASIVFYITKYEYEILTKLFMVIQLMCNLFQQQLMLGVSPTVL